MIITHYANYLELHIPLQGVYQGHISRPYQPPVISLSCSVHSLSHLGNYTEPLKLSSWLSEIIIMVIWNYHHGYLRLAWPTIVIIMANIDIMCWLLWYRMGNWAITLTWLMVWLIGCLWPVTMVTSDHGNQYHRWYLSALYFVECCL